MTLSLCHPVYSNIAAVWVCCDRWVYKVFLWKFWVDQSLSAVVLPLDTVCMCVSCVNCWLLSSQQLCVCLVLSFVLGHIGIWMLGGGGGVYICVNGLSPLGLSLCVCTHIDTLPLTAPYVPTRGTPCPLRLCVLMEQTHNTPGPTYGGAGAYPVSVVHHGDQARPSSFPLSQPRIVYLPGLCEGYGCLRTGAQSSKQARCKTFFSSWQTLCSGSTWKSGKEKKKTVVAVRGCMPIAFIHDIFEVMDGWQKNTNSGFLLDLTLRIILHCYIFLITSVVLGFSVDFLFVVMLSVLYVLS